MLARTLDDDYLRHRIFAMQQAVDEKREEALIAGAFPADIDLKLTLRTSQRPWVWEAILV